jgi:hypothetical protein
MSISSEIVSVSIAVQDRAPQQANFGTVGIFCNAPFIGGRYYELSPEGLAALVTDGFTTADRGYQLVQSMASQSPHTDRALVYNRAANNSQIIRLTPTITTVGFRYEFTLRAGTTEALIGFTVVTGTVAAIITGILAAIAASTVSAAVTETDGTTHVQLIPTVAGTHIQVDGAPRALLVSDTSTDAGIATDLAAAALDFEFYQFTIDSYAETEINAAAAWAEANKKIFVPQSADSTNVVDAAGTGVGQDLFAAGYHRTALLHTRDMSGNAAAGLIARQASQDPGESSFAYKDIVGAEPDSFTATEIANAKGKNIMLFINSDGVRHTLYGKAASGRSLRVTIGIDYIEARIKEAVLTVFANAEYVPYSQRGFSMLEAAVRGVLASVEIDSAGNGFVEPGWTVTVPIAAQQSTAKKVAGDVSPIKFFCVIPTDALKVGVTGSVSL